MKCIDPEVHLDLAKVLPNALIHYVCAVCAFSMDNKTVMLIN